MCMNGAHKWRSVAAVAVGEQEAEKWYKTNHPEIKKFLKLCRSKNGHFSLVVSLYK